MQYTEVDITIDVLDPFKDVVVYELGEGDYDSFVDTPTGVKAYVPTEKFDEQWLRDTLADCGCNTAYTVAVMPDKNWNEEWEKGHKSVLVEGAKTVYVRAPFHPHIEADYEIVIEPKMSFGTAHHATTYMMLSYLSELPIEGRRVLDMGCGTAVLAILAKMRGAAEVMGIDVDEWAYRNALENAETNGVQIDCRLGDADTLAACGKFDLVIANINRNILLNDMPKYVAAMNSGATILFSGFYVADIPYLVSKGEELGLRLEEQRDRDGWAAIRFIKN